MQSSHTDTHPHSHMQAAHSHSGQTVPAAAATVSAPPPQQQLEQAIAQVTHTLRQVEEYCSRYLDYLSRELLQVSVAGERTDGRQTAPTLASAAALAASAPPGSLLSILCAPEHQPSAVPRLQQNDVSPLWASGMQLEYPLDVNEQMRSASAAACREQQGESDSDDSDGEEGQAGPGARGRRGAEEEEESSSSDSDEEYRPNGGSSHPKKKARKGAEGSGSLTQAIFSTQLSKHGRVVKRKQFAEGTEQQSEDSEEDEEEEEEEEEEKESRPKSKKKSTKQAAQQQVPVYDSKQRRSKLPLRAVMTLRTFFIAHIDKPFPSDGEKQQLSAETNLHFKQISDWMTNTRKRFWRPYVDHLESVGCILAKNPWAICKCKGEGGEEEDSKKKGAAAAASSSEPAAAASSVLRGPVHAWIHMWN